MGKNINISKMNTEYSSLLIHKELADSLSVQEYQLYKLHFGKKDALVTVITSEHIPPDHVYIDKKTYGFLKVPDSIKANLMMSGNNIVIGPLIGILAAGKKRALRKMLAVLAEDSKLYETAGISLAVFSLEGISLSDSVIKGYILHADKNNWKKVVLPYPAAVIKRIKVNNNWEEHLAAVFGKSILNLYNFDKWEMYQWLKGHPELNKYLPDTKLYTGPDDVINFLKQTNKCYIKKSFSSFGRNIYKVTRKPDGYQLNYLKKKSQMDIYLNDNDLYTFLEENSQTEEYLIQQCINLQLINNRTMDFRHILVKDEKGNWINEGCIGKRGSINSIVTNTNSFLKPGRLLLRDSQYFNRKEAVELSDEMARLSVKFAQAIEETCPAKGNYAYLGIDMAIDRDKNIWLLEINNVNPRHRLAKYAGYPNIYEKAVLNCLHFAKEVSLDFSDHSAAFSKDVTE